MKRLVFALALTAFTAVALADVDPDMEMFGGWVKKPNSSRGKVVFLNAQKRVSSVEFSKVFEVIDFYIKAPFELKTIEKVSLPNPKTDISAAGGNVGVLLVDVPNYPALTVAPEEGWALVNVAALSADKPNDTTLASRTRKELLRAFALAGGCSFMARGAMVLRSDIHRPSDLDYLKKETFGVDAINGLTRSLPRLGVRPWVVVTYEDACQQGWAMQPTNEYQKAIWDKVHTIPSKPLKIEYNEKRDKGK